MPIDRRSVATRGYDTNNGFSRRAIAVRGYILFVVEELPPTDGGDKRFRIRPRVGGEPVWSPYYKSEYDEVIEVPYRFQEEDLFLIITMFLKYESEGLFN